jgi:predicted DNA-binding protein
MVMTDNIIRTTVRIREDLYIKLKLLATTRGVPFTDVLNEAIEEYVQKREDEIKRRISEALTKQGGT